MLGGVIGSFAGGSASSKVSNAVLGSFIEDDAEEMIHIIEEVFQNLAVDYLLNKKEVENIVDSLQNDLSTGTLQDMFASSNHEKFAKKLLKKHIKEEIKNRQKVVMPSDKEMQKVLREVLEEMADEEGV